MAMDIMKMMAGNARLIVLPRYIRWMKSNGQTSLIPNDGSEGIGGTVLRQMVEMPRVRSGSFSASSAGFCERAQVFGYHGADAPGPDAQLSFIFDDGKWRHIRWQTNLLRAGILSDIEVPLFWTRMKQRGTMDGLGVVPEDHYVKEWRGREFGFELKGVNAFQFDRLKAEGPMEKHLDQVHRYFLISGLDLFSIVYENKSTQEPFEWVIEPDPDRMEAQRREVESLFDHAEEETLPPQLPECVNKKGAWKTCGYGGPDGVCTFAKTVSDIQKHKERP